MLLYCTNLSCTNNLSLAFANTHTAPPHLLIFDIFESVHAACVCMCGTENHCVQLCSVYSPKRLPAARLPAAATAAAAATACCRLIYFSCTQQSPPGGPAALAAPLPRSTNNPIMRIACALRHVYTLSRNDRYVYGATSYWHYCRRIQPQLRSATRPYFVGSIIGREYCRSLIIIAHARTRSGTRTRTHDGQTHAHAAIRCAKVNMCNGQRQSDSPPAACARVQERIHSICSRAERRLIYDCHATV